jgi:DNA mismatch repair ATPase MutS
MYKCVAGWSSNSYGLGCALGAGVPVPVVQRAVEVGKMFQNREKISPLREASVTNHVEKNRDVLHQVIALGRELYTQRHQDELLPRVEQFMDLLRRGGKVKDEVVVKEADKRYI